MHTYNEQIINTTITFKKERNLNIAQKNSISLVNEQPYPNAVLKEYTI